MLHALNYTRSYDTLLIISRLHCVRCSSSRISRRPSMHQDYIIRLHRWKSNMNMETHRYKIHSIVDHRSFTNQWIHSLIFCNRHWLTNWPHSDTKWCASIIVAPWYVRLAKMQLASMQMPITVRLAASMVYEIQKWLHENVPYPLSFNICINL